LPLAYERRSAKILGTTTPKTTEAEFPKGSSVNIQGYDGIVRCSEKTAYVPEGFSVWELGTDNNPKAKADKDYEKRTNDPGNIIPAETVYIFITPKIWQNKTVWKTEKEKQKIWKEVLVYDSRDIEEWLMLAPAVSYWFAIEINKYPHDGIQSFEDFWKEYSTGPRGILPLEIVTSGREGEAQLLRDFLNGQPGLKCIKASSKEEAIAFIIASILLFDQPFKELICSKGLIIDTATNFRSISNNRDSLIFISRIEETQIL
jgi:hypothetical protein